MKKILLSLLILPIFIAVPAGMVHAANEVENPVNVFHDVCKGQASDSNICKDASEKRDKDNNVINPIFGPQGIVTKVANLLSIAIGIAAIIGIIFAGIKMVTNGDNPQEVSEARDLIIYAIVGLVLAAIAQSLVRLVLFNI